MTPRNEVIQIKVTAEEKAKIEKEAKELGVPTSALIRDRAILRGAKEKALRNVQVQTHVKRSRLRRDADEDPATIDEAREAVENDPANLNVTLDEKGSVVKDTREEVLRVAERDSWIGSTARILMMEKGLSKVAATMQASKAWDKRNG